jgi:hypothetical protein
VASIGELKELVDALNGDSGYCTPAFPTPVATADV